MSYPHLFCVLITFCLFTSDPAVLPPRQPRAQPPTPSSPAVPGSAKTTSYLGEYFLSLCFFICMQFVSVHICSFLFKGIKIGIFYIICALEVKSIHAYRIFNLLLSHIPRRRILWCLYFIRFCVCYV